MQGKQHAAEQPDAPSPARDKRNKATQQQRRQTPRFEHVGPRSIQSTRTPRARTPRVAQTRTDAPAACPRAPPPRPVGMERVETVHGMGRRRFIRAGPRGGHPRGRRAARREGAAWWTATDRPLSCRPSEPPTEAERRKAENGSRRQRIVAKKRRVAPPPRCRRGGARESAATRRRLKNGSRDGGAGGAGSSIAPSQASCSSATASNSTRRTRAC